MKLIKIECLNSYLLYEPNIALCAFTDALELKFQISNLMGKIIQNIKISPVNQNSDSTLKLNPISQMSPGLCSVSKRATISSY